MAFSITHWTPEEDALLLERLANERLCTIARSFPSRTEKSVLSRAAKLRGPDGRDFHRRKAVNSSEKLEVAIKALIERMRPSVVAEVMGAPCLVEPGTERIRKTSELMRMAA